MNQARLSLSLLLMLTVIPRIYAQDTRAASIRNNAKVQFWQSGLVSDGKDCEMEFTFDGTALNSEIDKLALFIRIHTKDEREIWHGYLNLLRPLGGKSKYVRAQFVTEILPSQTGGAESIQPICDKGNRIAIESAIGIQSGRKVDLVRFKQLKLIEGRKINVTIKQ